MALNLFRNARRTGGRRRARLGPFRAEAAHSDPWPSPGEALSAVEERELVRRALARLEPRERELLLLRAEGYRYREIAAALGLNEASVGTFLARARRSFRDAYGEVIDASRR